MLTIIQITFHSRRAQRLPLVNERFVIDDSVAVFICFFELGPLFKLPFGADVLDGFLLSTKDSLSTVW
jgi:hypothetical protein